MPWRLTELATEDLISIAEYTSRQWGTDQAVKYKTSLVSHFDRIAINPLIVGSRSQDEYLPGSRSVLVGRHIVIYRLNDGFTEILRILHQRMNLSLHHLR